MTNARRLVRGGVLASLFLLGFSLCLTAYSYVRIVRLSYVEGEVYVERPGTGSERGIANLPLVHDAVVETAEGVAEIEFESDAFARLAANSRLHLTELALRDTGGRVTTLTLERGMATFYADPRRDDSFLVLTPYFQASVPKSARFRIDLTSNGGRVLVFDGEVSLDSRAGAMNLGKGRMFEWDQTSQEFLVARNPERDSWDQWNAERDHQVDASRHEAIPVHLSYGVYDLQRYGQWTSLVGFGPVWQPYAAIGWSPFVYGRWVWYPAFGWTWVSYEPWGWLPYHYGNWHYDPFWGWVWVPGFFDVWSPARCLWVYQSGWVGWAPLPPPGRHFTVFQENPTRLPHGTVIVRDRDFERGETPRLVEDVRELAGGRWNVGDAPPPEIAKAHRRARSNAPARVRPDIEFDPRERRYVNRSGAEPGAPSGGQARETLPRAGDQDNEPQRGVPLRSPLRSRGAERGHRDPEPDRPGPVFRPSAPARPSRVEDSPRPLGRPRSTERSRPTAPSRPSASPRPAPRVHDAPRPGPASRQAAPARPATSAPRAAPAPSAPRESARPAARPASRSRAH